jgi:hypothetical protein
MSGELLDLEAAAPIAGVTAAQLRRAARAGRLKGAAKRRGRWRVTREGALAYRAADRGPGRPASAGLETSEVVGVTPEYSCWRARIGDGPWSVSSTEQGAIRAAHVAERKRRLIESQRSELERWWGRPTRELVAVEWALEAGARIVVRSRRGGNRRAVVLEVSRSGRVTAGYRVGDRVHVVSLGAADVLEEVARVS